MLQTQYNDMVLKVSQLERFTDQQNTTLNNVVDKINDEASRSDRSIPGIINTAGTPSTSESLALSMAQALIVSLTVSLADTERGVLGPVNEAVDQRLTQYEDPNQTEKKCKNKLYYNSKRWRP